MQCHVYCRKLRKTKYIGWIFDANNFMYYESTLAEGVPSTMRKVEMVKDIYRISANSFRGNYSFLEVGVRKLFKGGNYSREETI